MKHFTLTNTDDLERMLRETRQTELEQSPVSDELVTEAEFEDLLSIVRKHETSDQRDERVTRTFGTRVLEPRSRDRRSQTGRSVIL